MGWNQSIFPLLIIPSGSPNTGLFVYNGPPAKGNLVAAIVAPGVTTDPYGNSVAAVFNAGHWNAAGNLLQHFGVDSNGDIYLASSTGATIVRGHSANGALWFYNASGQGLNNILSSIAPAAGTDVPGNAIVQGIASYASGTPAINAQMTAGALQFNRPSNASAATVGSNNSAPLILSSGQVNANDTQASLSLDAGLTGVAPLAILPGGVLELFEAISVPPAATGLFSGPTLFGTAKGQLSYVADTNNGDGNTYNTGTITLWNTTDTTINVSGASFITIGTCQAAANIYRVSMRIIGTMGANPGSMTIGFSGPAINYCRLQFKTFIDNNAVASVIGTGSINTFGTFTTTALTATDAYIIEADGIVSFSAAGTVNFQAQEGTAGDTWTLVHPSFATLSPLG